MLLSRRAFAAGSAIALLIPKAWAQQSPSPVTGKPRLAIGGYDTVAYFTDGKPVPGKPEFTFQWHDENWQFASAAHRDLFIAHPEQYAPQYDGYCAMGVAHEAGTKLTGDPTAWTIVNGKLYVNSSTHWRDEWRKDTAANISRADVNWATVKNMPEPKS